MNDINPDGQIVLPPQPDEIIKPRTGMVFVPVAGLPGKDGAAAIPEVIDCGGPFDTTGA